MSSVPSSSSHIMPPASAQVSPSAGQSSPFHSYPQKFPRASRKADDVVSALISIMRKGPQSIPATVVDTSFHTSMGYVLCTTESAVIRVYAVPFGTVIPQMRIYCRRLGSHNTNVAYIYDGQAPNLSGLGLSSGSLLTNVVWTTPVAMASTTTGGVPSAPALSTSSGYYWHCFFYVPALPTSAVTLMMLSQSGGGSNTLSLEYLPSGYLQFRSQDGHGYLSSGTVPPHLIHYVQIQPGLTGQEMLIDGQATYSSLIGSSGDKPTFSGAGATYTLSLLSTLSGTQQTTPGSWISKMGYGVSSNAGTVIPLSIGTSIPSQDSDIPLFNISSTQQSLCVYLCDDGVGSSILANKAASWSGGSPITLNTSFLSVLSSGPY